MSLLTCLATTVSYIRKMVLLLATSHELRGKFIEALDEVQQMNKKFPKLKKKKLCTFSSNGAASFCLKTSRRKSSRLQKKSGLGMFGVCGVSEYGKPGEMKSVHQMSVY